MFIVSYEQATRLTLHVHDDDDVLYFTFEMVFYLISVFSASTALSQTQLSEGEAATLLKQVDEKMKALEVARETLRVRMENQEQELQNKVDGYRLVTTGCTGVCRCVCVCGGGMHRCTHAYTYCIFNWVYYTNHEQ
jgi:hypothetical protein